MVTKSSKRMGPIINIDHHDTNEAFGFLNIIDQRASSTAEIIYLILKSLDVQIDFDIAVNLYTAILTDTGSFRYDNTNSKAFIICEEMTHFGVSPVLRCRRRCTRAIPRNGFELLCLALATLETYHGQQARHHAHHRGHVQADRQDRREQAEGFVEFLKEMRGVEVAVVARQIGEGPV